NMLFLWWFGRQVEDDLGSREFLLFYLVSAVLAGLAFVGIDVLAVNVMHLSPAHGAVVGASGAVMAVLLAAACANPRQTVFLMFLVPVPIWVLIVVFLLIDSHGLLRLLQGRGSGVAVACPLGGAAFGFLYYRNGWRLAALTSWLRLP